MNSPLPRLERLGESGWLVVLGESVDRAVNRQVLGLAQAIEAAGLPGVLEVVPAYCTVGVFFNATVASAVSVEAALRDLAVTPSPRSARPPAPAPAASTLHTIPVRYDGPDLEEVARRTGLSPEEVVRRHASVEYFAYMLGFVPGFAYLGDLDPVLVLPRRATPRTRVPAGSVAIAGSQTAVYPLATPGGWHLIGRTETRCFDPARTPAALLSAGDRVRFEPIR